MTLSPFSIDAVKGWTRCSAVAFIALAVSEMDVTDKETQDLLVPLHKVLDKSWLLPMHAAWINLVIAICFLTLLGSCPLSCCCVASYTVSKKFPSKENYKYQKQ